VKQAERAGVFADDRKTDDAEAIDARFTQLCERANAGDAAADGVVRQAAAYLSVLIAVLTNMLDVDRVVLGGPFWSRIAPIYLEELPDRLDRLSATRAIRRIPIDGTIVGDAVGAVGAACVVLDSVLTPRTSALLLES
jgi:predicted NBD/HSP70 family sugar kinase